MPAVTVVVPCYNLERYLGQTVESVFAQTLASWELVVVDDGSPGDVEAAIAPYRSDPRVRLVRQPNGGLCSARNFGFRNSSADSRYLLFLDADDVLEAEMLQTLVACLDSHPEVGMAFCDRTLIDPEGRPIEAYRDDLIRRYVRHGRWIRPLRADEADTPFESFFGYSITVPSLTLLRRSVFCRAGEWDEDLGPICDDTDMWLRVSLCSHAYYVPRKLLQRRLHGSSLTRSVSGERRRRDAQREFERKWAKLDRLAPSQRKIVRNARRFREGRLLPYLWFTWTRERLRRGEPVEAAKCWLRGCRQLALHGAGALILPDHPSPQETS
jgi:glycosyltransferase involved in cell wall biosynthesis